MAKAKNVGIIADTHIPFTVPGYLEFCKKTFKEHDCDTIVHIGDFFDQHAISYHEKDPNGYSPGHEFKAALKEAKRWYRAFPEVKWCIGNHDALIERKVKSSGLPAAFMRRIEDIYEIPAGWEVDWNFIISGVLYRHGTGSCGVNAAFQAALSNRMSVVQGHVHTTASVRHHASPHDSIFGMAVGCGIDREAYAFSYGKDFKDKPFVSCGVVKNHGKQPIVIPMPL